jgi:hypothetical protein
VLISERQAAKRLAAVGVTYRQVREVLRSGIAGEPLCPPGASLHDAAAVDALASWPVVTDELVDASCPWGLFIARQRPATWTETWAFSPMTSVWIRSRIERHGHLPFVATLCGFVTGGAEITGTIPVRGGGYQLRLRDPGPWFDAFRDHRLLSGRGRPWVVRESRHGKLVT